MSIDRLSSAQRTGTRSAILDACWRLLDQGVPPSMEAVADAAGVSRQALYLHFRGRTELLLATVEHVRARLGVPEAYDRVLAEHDPEAALAALMELHARFTPRIVASTRALEAERARDPAFDAAWRRRDQSRARLVEHVAATIARASRLRAGWSEREAADLLWVLTSTRTVEALTERGWAPDQVARRVRAVAAAALLADQADHPLEETP